MSDSKLPESEREPAQNAFISFDVTSCINFASAQNSVAVVRSLSIRNKTEEELRGLTLTVDAQPPLLRTKHWHLDSIQARSKVPIQDRDIQLELALLDAQNEAERGHLTFGLTASGEELVKREVPIKVLARDEWGGVGTMDSLIAAFASPNDPAIASLVRQAAGILEANGHDSAMDGYRSGDPRRPWMIAAALWSACSALNLAYAQPPASFEQRGQKIRGPGPSWPSGWPLEPPRVSRRPLRLSQAVTA